MTPPSLRTFSGMLSLAALVGLALWVQAGRADLWPAVVVAESTFRLSGVEPGQYAWTLEDGRVPQGGGLLSQRTVIFERSDHVTLELTAGLKSGDRVVAGQPLASLRSVLLDEAARTLEAERALVAARRDLMVAGARPEEVAQARKALEVAGALAEGAKLDRARAQTLVQAGAASTAVLELATLTERVQSLERELALATVAVVRAEARPEELAALDAELFSVDTQLEATRARLRDAVISSPIDGVLSLGQRTDLVTGDTTLLRVQDMDPVVLRIPLPQHSRADVATGQTLHFESAAAPDQDFVATIIAVAEEAAPLNGQQIFWITAAVENGGGVLQPGVSGWASREELAL